MISIAQLINDKKNPAANQFVVISEDAIYFQSYSSIIVKKPNNDDKIYLSPDWDYSHTTLKHLYIFLRDYTRYSVYSKKDVENFIKQGIFVETNKRINID